MPCNCYIPTKDINPGSSPSNAIVENPHYYSYIPAPENPQATSGKDTFPTQKSHYLETTSPYKTKKGANQSRRTSILTHTQKGALRFPPNRRSEFEIGKASLPVTPTNNTLHTYTQGPLPDPATNHSQITQHPPPPALPSLPFPFCPI